MKRRKFLKDSVLSASAFSIVPASVLSKSGRKAPSDQLSIALIGAGGRGNAHWNAVKDSDHGNIVALVDVDDNRAADAFKNNPKAKRFRNYKELESIKDEFDAFMLATPDNTHAVIGMAMMDLGKHAYIEKPLAHDIYEVRMLTEKAAEKNLVTQMGNHGSSGDGIRQICEWIWGGVIGDVTEVFCWTNRPVWPQGKPAPTQAMPIPDHLDWDLWLGPAKYTHYHPDYSHFKWRGWWDFGTGALGDMGCHIIDPAFKALKLGYPTEVTSSNTTVWVGDFVEADYSKSCPPSSITQLKFPAREGMPEVKMHWHDGGLMPSFPDGIDPNEKIGNWDGGVLFVGSKGMLSAGCYGANPKLHFPDNNIPEVPEPHLSRVENGTGGHQEQWIKACKDGSETSSPFSYAGPLSETVLMGNLGIRSYQMKVLQEGKTPTSWAPYDYPGRKKLLWDGENMKVTNFDEANEFVKREYRDGWTL
ncbi:Gfo/Idh/MocA family protein [Membranihabitans maritimus]|uniref:Gfo/Idh/MocA family protein n=1 Tax=Membranihabitans maritimus TaxID=2904244 RepID=UPI001F2EE6AB|nr:Gfo/Idh/MocA family oxidoreductase [Membranihabitans maritimus]